MDYSELPEHILHLIQYFLTPKESAKTTLLSKPWSTAWSTRPTIDLDESRFPNGGLAEYATKTIRRYEESNLRIDTFSLSRTSCEASDLYAEFTSKALKMGATDLTVQFKFLARHYLTRLPRPNMDVLLDQVFRSENVVRLRLSRLIIERQEVTKCSLGLKSLTLSHVEISHESLLNILSFCPLVENLSLSDVSSEYDEYRPVDEQLLITRKFHKLSSLELCSVEYYLLTWFLDHLSSKFPNLKDLTVSITLCYSFFNGGPRQEKHLVSSPSLEIINFTGVRSRYDYAEREEVPMFEFDVPSIRKFTLYWSRIPQLCFTSSSSLDQCEFHVSLIHEGYTNYLTPRWFHNLSKFLTKLRGSEIHLCLHVLSENEIHYKEVLPVVKGLDVCEVENLTIDTYGVLHMSCNAILDGLFRICRPKMITQYVRQPSKYDNQNNDFFLFRALKRGLEVESSMMPNKFMYGLRDLKEVNVQQLFDDGVWRSTQSLDSSVFETMPRFVKYLRSVGRRFRFQLKWKPFVS